MDTSKMPPDVWRKLFDIRCRSKEGRPFTEAERRFFIDCYKKWPEDYAAMGKEVFEETKPFGSK